MAAARQHLAETRNGVDLLYAGAQSEVTNLQQTIMVLGQRVTDLEGTVAATQQAGSGGSGPAGGNVGGGNGGGDASPPAARLPQSMGSPSRPMDSRQLRPLAAGW